MATELYKHNKKAYENVQKHLEKTNRTCVIHPTGSGKSFISLKFLFDNRDKKCLFMCPTDAIVDQVKRHIENEGLKLSDFPNLEFCLYASANKVSKNKYDAIVFDEFHRIGADEWGKNVNALLENNEEAKILGVSATPIRYLDDNRNMAEEIFNGDIASEITLPEAILKGILPTPKYVSTLYTFEEDIKEIERKIELYKDKSKVKELQDLLNQAKKKIENSEGLDEIFSKNITNKNGKFIVFCRNMEHMREMEEKCLEWFKKTNPDIEISDVHSKKGKELNQYYIDYFENNEKKTIKLLFSIEMLNEGLHVKNIDGVIMFRPTSSPIIYMQQLGRALSVGHNDHPLIFDIVNNSASLESVLNIKKDIESLERQIIYDRENEIDEHEDYESNDELLKILDSFKIIEEQKDIIDALNSLKQDVTYTWEDWYKLAKAYYEHHGNLEIKNEFKTINGYEEYPDGVALGKWIANQRGAYKEKGVHKITPKQIELLNQIGMRWENIDAKDQWLEKYNLAKAYYEHHGNLEIKKAFKTTNGYEEDPDGVNLGTWIANQRKAYKGQGSNKITPEQIELLNQIGMRWENIDAMDQWLEKYNLAKAYYEHHGNLEIKKAFKTTNGYEEDPDGVNLGTWIARQKSVYKGQGSNKITPKQIELLNQIGMRWENIDTMDQWLEKYNLAKAYYEHHGNLEIKNEFKTTNGYEEDPDGVALGRWIANQKSAYKGQGTSKIAPKQIELLNQIGMRWENKIERMEWEDWYNLAKAYYNHYGNLDVTKRYKTTNGYEYNENGVALGSWITIQRSAYKGKGNSKITPEQIELLEDIGIEWFDKKIDDKLQSEEITDKNKLQKQKEMLNRFYSLMSKYDGDSLPSKEELDDAFMDQLNRKIK